MTAVTARQIQQSVESIADPHSGAAIGAAKAVRGVSLDNGALRVDIALGYPARSWHPALTDQVKARIGELDAALAAAAEVTVTTKVSTHSVQKGAKPLRGVKNIIAIASGKGGVGKSTVAANLALALSTEGARAGILDADIYGPSQPRMMGVNQKPQSKDGRSMEPVLSHGLQTMSIGFLIDEETPMIWRGPMVTQALEQLLKDTAWDNLDYLVIDLPPGTGDIQLTLAQKVPVTGAVIVTTPQDIALLDARKAYKMFEKVEIPVFGVVENMSGYVCPQCGHAEAVFGAGGGEKMARDYGVALLGKVPLAMRVREDADGGRPTVAADPEHPVARAYLAIARTTAARLAAQGKDYSAAFPDIVVQNT